jgi:hypothetical protein
MPLDALAELAGGIEIHELGEDGLAGVQGRSPLGGLGESAISARPISNQ